MVIDFHTHTFPDKIAPQTIAALAEKSGSTPYRNGTLSSLLESMRKNGVDYSVILPVATKPSQVPSINRLAAQLNGTDGIIYAGSRRGILTAVVSNKADFAVQQLCAQFFPGQFDAVAEEDGNLYFDLKDLFLSRDSL